MNCCCMTPQCSTAHHQLDVATTPTCICQSCFTNFSFQPTSLSCYSISIPCFQTLINFFSIFIGFGNRLWSFDKLKNQVLHCSHFTPLSYILVCHSFYHCLSSHCLTGVFKSYSVSLLSLLLSNVHAILPRFL